MVKPSTWVVNCLEDICTVNICPCNICPSLNIMEYLSWYQSNFNQTLKIGLRDSKIFLTLFFLSIFLEQIIFFGLKFIFIEIFGTKIFLHPSFLDQKFLWTQNLSGTKIFWATIFLDSKYFWSLREAFIRKNRKYIGLLPKRGGGYPPTNIFPVFSWRKFVLLKMIYMLWNM